MTRLSLAYAGAASLFLAADLIWLGLIARDMYRSQMAHLITADFRFGPAAIFYLVYIAGVVYFAIIPALASGRWQDAALRGAVLGLIAYGTYDFTNWAIMRDWPVALTFIDLAWGVALTAAAATAGAVIALKFG